MRLATLTILIGGVLALPAVAQGASETDCGGSPATSASDPSSFTSFWARSGPGWTGGDGAISVPIDSGRTLWLFGDSILGTVAPDGTRAPGAPTVHNTLVVQDGGCITTYFGATVASPTAMFTPATGGDWFWPAAAIASGGTVTILLTEYSGNDQGLSGFQHVGDSVAVVSLADMSLVSLTPLPASPGITWGAALLDDGGYTYLYGTEEGVDGNKYAHVARAPDGSLATPSAWQYYTGLGWSSDATASSRIASGVSNLFSVLKTDTGYTLITEATYPSLNIDEYQAAAPAGPFLQGVQMATLPDPGTGEAAYNALAHPEFDGGGQLLIGYSVAPTTEDFTNASVYRPRFTSIPIPTYGVAPSPTVVTGGGSSAPPPTQGATPTQSTPPKTSPPPVTRTPTGRTPIARSAGLLLSLVGGRVRVRRDGRFAVTAACARGILPCAGTLTLSTVAPRAHGRSATVPLATAALRIAAGHRVVVRGRLARGALTLLRRLHRLRLRASALLFGAGRITPGGSVTLLPGIA